MEKRNRIAGYGFLPLDLDVCSANKTGLTTIILDLTEAQNSTTVINYLLRSAAHRRPLKIFEYEGVFERYYFDGLERPTLAEELPDLEGDEIIEQPFRPSGGLVWKVCDGIARLARIFIAAKKLNVLYYACSRKKDKFVYIIAGNDFVGREIELQERFHAKGLKHVSVIPGCDRQYLEGTKYDTRKVLEDPPMKVKTAEEELNEIESLIDEQLIHQDYSQNEYDQDQLEQADLTDSLISLSEYEQEIQPENGSERTPQEEYGPSSNSQRDISVDFDAIRSFTLASRDDIVIHSVQQRLMQRVGGELYGEYDPNMQIQMVLDFDNALPEDYNDEQIVEVSEDEGQAALVPLERERLEEVLRDRGVIFDNIITQMMQDQIPGELYERFLQVMNIIFMEAEMYFDRYIQHGIDTIYIREIIHIQGNVLVTSSFYTRTLSSDDEIKVDMQTRFNQLDEAFQNDVLLEQEFREAQEQLDEQEQTIQTHRDQIRDESINEHNDSLTVDFRGEPGKNFGPRRPPRLQENIVVDEIAEFEEIASEGAPSIQNLQLERSKSNFSDCSSLYSETTESSFEFEENNNYDEEWDQVEVLEEQILTIQQRLKIVSLKEILPLIKKIYGRDFSLQKMMQTPEGDREIEKLLKLVQNKTQKTITGIQEIYRHFRRREDNINILKTFIRRKKIAKKNVYAEYAKCLERLLQNQFFRRLVRWIINELLKSEEQKSQSVLNKTLIVYGETGVGKTTFVQKILNPLFKAGQIHLNSPFQQESSIHSSVRLFYSPDDAEINSLYQYTLIPNQELPINVKYTGYLSSETTNSMILLTNHSFGQIKRVLQTSNYWDRFRRRCQFVDIDLSCFYKYFAAYDSFICGQSVTQEEIVYCFWLWILNRIPKLKKKIHQTDRVDIERQPYLGRRGK